ncbi:MAG: hypothetical protein JNL82_04225 [Myxococcales bacterium]|nr:hypothetical protein [Myxococcales bacterium]
MRTRSLVSLVLACLSLASVGCDVDGAALDEDIRLRPGWCTQCGGIYSNAAIVNGAALSDINLEGVSTGGIKLRPGNSVYGEFVLDIDPVNDRFVGVVTGADELAITGAQFVGAKIVLEMPGGTVIDLEITHYDEDVQSWSKGGARVTAYRAQYLGPQGVPTPLCPTTDIDNQWFTLIGGEIYGPQGITAAPRSLTIACVGEAAAKMKLLDFHPAGTRGATVAQRQATLRMITADYCGTGQSFTATGTPVAWRDADGRVTPPFGEDVMEALWDEHGAICLDTPRVVARGDVDAVCSLPTCEGMALTDGATWRTMTPAHDE